jgi:putative MATE family efflux protein
MRGYSSTEDYIRHASLWRIMPDLTWPAILGMSFYALNTFVDAVFVGQLIGESAVAGVSLAFPLTNIAMGVAAMLGSGFGAVLSLSIGERNRELMEKVPGAMMALNLIFTVPLSLGGLFFSRELIASMGGSGAALDAGAEYLLHSALLFPLTAYAVAANMLIRAEGNMRRAMGILGITAALNIVLNPLLVRTAGFGVAGSAWATNIAMIVLALAGAGYFRSTKSSIGRAVPLFWPAWDVMRRSLGIGISTFILQGLAVLQQIFIFRLVADYGSQRDTAVMGAGIRILTLCVFPVMGIVRSVQPVIGINFGAGDVRRARDAYFVFTAGGLFLMTLIWLPLTIFPDTVLGWVLPGTALTGEDLTNFRILIVVLPILPGVLNGLTFFQAVGQAKIAGILAVLRQFIVFVPAILILPRFFGVNGLYYGMTAVDLIVISILFILLAREFRRLVPRGA